jgi:hypothetical protein
LFEELGPLPTGVAKCKLPPSRKKADEAKQDINLLASPLQGAFDAFEPVNLRVELVCFFPPENEAVPAVCIKSNGLDAALAEISGLVYCTSQFNWCDKSMKKSKDNFALADCSQKKARTTIKRLVRNGL